jgi:hypothetical protein
MKKKFIYHVLLFLLLPTIIILFSDTFLRNQNSLYKEKYEGALRCKDSIEIIILGNSHANYGVDPNAFDLFAYNLANAAQSIYFDKRITISLLPYFKKLKYVFISVDYHSLYFSSQGSHEDIWSYYGNGIKYKKSNYFLANISPTLFGYTPRVSWSLFKKKIVNNLKYGTDIIDFDVENGINLKGSIAKGFISFEGNNNSGFTIEKYKHKAYGFNELIEASNEKDEILADLKDFLEVLIRNNITPILFTSPTYQEYNKYLDKSVINNNIKEIKKICEKYNIEYLDFMNSNTFEKNDFYNADHLNKKGAKKLSKILNYLITNNKKHGLDYNIYPGEDSAAIQSN